MRLARAEPPAAPGEPGKGRHTSALAGVVLLTPAPEAFVRHAASRAAARFCLTRSGLRARLLNVATPSTAAKLVASRDAVVK